MPHLLIAFLIGGSALLALNWLLRWAARVEERESERKRQRYMDRRTYYLRPVRQVGRGGLEYEMDAEGD